MSWAELARADLAAHAQVVVLVGDEVVVAEVAGPGTTTNTRFPLFSLSKALTAAVVLALVDAGQLELETRVSALVPPFANGGKQAVTVREVLLHLGGFPEPATFEPAVFLDPVAGVDALCRLERRPELVGVLSYHPFAFGIVGAVVEAAAGVPFAHAAQQLVLTPLGMTSTTWGLPTARDVAVPPIADPGWLRTLTEAGGCAFGAWSTATDVAALLSMLRHGGEGPHGRVLSEDAARGMTELGASGSPMNTGLGTFIGRAFGRGSKVSDRAFGHSGATAAQAWCDPDVDLTVVALTDSECSQQDSDARFNRLCDELLAEYGAPR